MTTAQEFLQNAWIQLGRGTVDKKHPFRFGVLGTASQQGANLRTVVVRKVNQVERTLWAYTDIRSPKVIELKTNPNVTWLFYHPRKQLQLRLYGKAVIWHNRTINQEVWDNLPSYGKTDYLMKEQPGAKLTENSVDFEQNSTNRNFGIIVTTINYIDYLQLSRAGHQRIGLEWDGQLWQGQFLVP